MVKQLLRFLLLKGGRKILKQANYDYKEIELREGDDIKLIKVIKTWR